MLSFFKKKKKKQVVDESLQPKDFTATEEKDLVKEKEEVVDKPLRKLSIDEEDYENQKIDKSNTSKNLDKDICVDIDEEAEEKEVASDIQASKGWIGRLKQGLSKTSSGISEGIGGIFTKRKLDDEMLEDLEELLIISDMGAVTSAKLVADFSKERFDKEITPQEVKNALAMQITKLLEPVAVPVDINKGDDVHVILVVGVNGNGKTTTMGKMAARFKASGHSVMMAAADTFRAAAVEQLQVWGERSGVPVVTAEQGTDSASVAYRALEKAKADGVDILMIDTAGRLHNKNNLMDELRKISRVLKKLDEGAPQTVLQVLDGTTGQNAVAQVESFQKLIGVTGLVVTKLDGTAKGGVVVSLADKFGLPVHAVGVGESIDDLREFSASDYARGLVGL